jgi:hypothetical protein
MNHNALPRAGYGADASLMKTERVVTSVEYYLEK